MQKVLFVRSGSRYRVAKPAEVLEAAAFHNARKLEISRPTMHSPEFVSAFLLGQLAHCEEEFFCTMFLDSSLRMIAFEKSFRGTIDGSSVHPREVVKAVLDRNASAVIFAHNHPSGVLRPSAADEAITRRLVTTLALIDVRVLDHMIVGRDAVTSFTNHGLL